MLHSDDVDARLNKACSKRMTKVVKTDLWEARELHCLLETFLEVQKSFPDFPVARKD